MRGSGSGSRPETSEHDEQEDRRAGASGKTRLRLVVVVPNYRTAPLTINCLETLEGEIEAGRDLVIVVDNGSHDGSTRRIREIVAQRSWSQWVKLICSETNVGFPAGCNIGIRAANADAYMLLNNDTLVHKGAISSLLRAMYDHPDIGIVSSTQEWPDGTPQTCCFRFRTPISELLAAAATGPITRLFRRHEIAILPPYSVSRPDWTCFASVLIRRELIEQIGLLDGDYFNYFDDEDYSRRARRGGWGILHWPEARVVHLEGASQSVELLKRTRRRRPTYYYASRARYFAKFYGMPGLWLANALWAAGRLIALARELVGNKQPHACKKEWLDVWTNCWNPMKPPIPEHVVAPSGTMTDDRVRSMAAPARNNAMREEGHSMQICAKSSKA